MPFEKVRVPRGAGGGGGGGWGGGGGIDLCGVSTLIYMLTKIGI
jgi:hypothetical protein